MSDDQRRLRAQLQAHRQSRERGLAMAREELDAISELLPQALDAGIRKVELAELTGLSRPTINALLKKTGRR